MSKKLISFVIPVYNESESIPHLLKELATFIEKNESYDFEIMLVENGSTDDSYELLSTYAKKDKRFKVLQLSRNFECDGGIAAGLKYIKGDACVVMMADMQEPIEVVKKFIAKWEEGYEIVYGVVKKRTAGIVRNISSILFYKLLNMATHDSFPENVSDFRLMDRRVYEVVNNMPEQNKYLRGLVVWTGFKQSGVEFNRVNRVAGKSKADFITVARVAKNAFFSFSYLPLRFVTYTGIIMTIFSFVLIIYYLILFAIEGRVNPGITSILLLMLFLFGILFFILGIISEYIARIYEEAKDRPTHILRNKINIK
ncbi:glycosyltransferase [Candidatus Roizmanbacteria bacterium CG11_big_fil_rev_8_21_14_0_20_36_8]|uniref:Glycosyltransferase n=2 Tax=Candidatus Roizmaniibacteriota TaxID=1752723 RepID=A0A2M6ITG4_9BACT|nr:MAG: glycosyltransferase [Candidatus Roizmanbacteria bacterium CG11_big_fil_rev_8_21_14_0_20_36_8]PIZ65959.1 MAG: glycosyltransferase [Candidatus Roizmanbacteria bacterium CG_4_10_14_0_2_um_filter_36_9]